MINQLYTYFGCKKQITDLVWQALGQDTDTFFEPFAGTAVTTLNRPEWTNLKKVYLNDFDCHVANVLRSALYKYEELIDYICHPRLELDLHMISDYLTANDTKQYLRDLLMSKLDACDPRLAGYWCFGINHWIGGDWCNCILQKTDALTQHYDLDGGFFGGDPVGNEEIPSTNRKKLVNSEKLTHRQLPSTWRNKLEHGDQNTHRQLPSTGRNKLVNSERLTHRQLTNINRREWVEQLVMNIYEQLSEAKILYGDWKRLVTNSYLNDSKHNGIFLDPPYVGDARTQIRYGNDGGYEEHNKIFNECKQWFIDNYERDNCRIILCGHKEDFKDLPEDWRRVYWKRLSGYAKSKEKSSAECLILSKNCLDV